jgi:hypothetical protein
MLKKLVAPVNEERLQFVIKLEIRSQQLAYLEQVYGQWRHTLSCFKIDVLPKQIMQH